ncbi:MAG: hypothetical protein PHS80_00725 [Methanothrix sp.]|nr:hypothetical protein [Methanothrix sp.]MDD4447859.1 hypothetical protein [Methanothrix sp.]
MKFNINLSVMFLLMINTAFGAVGDVGVSDTSATISQEQSSLAGLDTNSYLPEQSGQASINQPSLLPYGSSSYDSSSYDGYPAQGQDNSQSRQSAYPAPQISGPMQEQMTAEQLGLSQPQMESFAPDERLDFVSASQPVDAARIITAPGQSSVPASTSSYVQATLPGSSIWYYPSSLVSANRFYVQTASGLRTVGGCSFQGYLPLWADIKSSGNFFVYEWYPGQSTPSVRWWGWTGSGWKKGWFCGDVSGWHILCYNSGIWSNYIYIYVYPRGFALSAPSGFSNAAASVSKASLPLNAPNPPDPAAERIVLPDFNQYRPITDAAFSSSGMGLVENPAIANPALASSSRKTCATCTSSTVITGGVSSSDPYETSCPNCAFPASQSAPYGYAAQSYQAVYPVPSICKCNEYYVQSCPGRLATVAGVFCGSWLPLWSKVSRPGTYWSFEWMTCSSGTGYYCSPEVKNFGYKSTGWYQTWFKANNPGWHILSYCCNDWSNYVYIYVWPAD